MKILNIIKVSICIFILMLILSLSSVSANTEKTGAYIYLKSQLEDMNEKIDVSGFNITASECGNILNLLLKREVYLFYVENTFSYTLSGNYVHMIFPSYSCDTKEALNAISFCKDEIDKILFYMPKGMSDAGKALYLHDYIAVNFEYDDTLTNSDLYLMLKNKSGTCQGYTYLYKALLDKVGIDSDIAYSDSIKHIWNILLIDGYWYHADVTWDDGEFFSVKHKNFLSTDEYFEANGHCDIVKGRYVACNSDKYENEKFRNMNCVFSYLNGKWYYAENFSGGRKISAYSIENRETETVQDIESYWRTGDSGFYSNSFSSVVTLGGNIYYNEKNKIYKLTSGKKEEIYSLFCGEIYYMKNVGGRIYFSVYNNGEYKLEYIEIMPNGDVDLDNKLDICDIVKLDMFLNGSCDIDAFNADLNRDGVVDSDDAIKMRYMLLSFD